MTTIQKYFSPIVFICSLLLFTGCNRDSGKTGSPEEMFGINPTMPIHFIIPVGFRGKISIVEDKTHGLVPPIVDGKITITIPPDGHLALRDWSPFLSEHEESASYSDGTTVPDPNMVPANSVFPEDKVGFRALGMDFAGKELQEKSLVWFVGAKTELNSLK